MILIVAYIFGFALFIALLVGAGAWMVMRKWTQPSWARTVFQRALLLLAVLGLMHFVFDLAFLTFVQSDGFGRSVSAKLWKHRYWTPINSQGYRDREHSLDELRAHRVVAVVGDSFVAGHGIDSADDRFANILGQMLGPDFRTVVLAQNGWGPEEELAALEALAVDPEVVVLSHYVNDIGPACTTLLAPSPSSGAMKSWTPLRLHVRTSPFASYIYWRVARMQNSLGDDYKTWLEACRASDAVRALHHEQIAAIVREARSRESEVVVVLIPSLNDLEGSTQSIETLDEWLNSQEVPTIDLRAHLEGREPAELVVNELDGHANVAVNREIAELLLREINALREVSSENAISNRTGE